MLIRLRIEKKIMDPFICGILWDLLNHMMGPTPAGSHIFWITSKDFSGTCLTPQKISREKVLSDMAKSTKQINEKQNPQNRLLKNSIYVVISVLLIHVLEINLPDLGIMTWTIVF